MGRTVKLNDAKLRKPAASVTVFVIVTVPARPACGVMVAVRLVPLPPKTMLPVGTRLVSDDDWLKVNKPADVESSPMVKAIGPVPVF